MVLCDRFDAIIGYYFEEKWQGRTVARANLLNFPFNVYINVRILIILIPLNLYGTVYKQNSAKGAWQLK